MNRYGLTFHHLGLAVNAQDKALIWLAGLGYTAGAAVFDPLQGVTLMMCEHPAMPSVEIICPGPEPGPLDKMLERFQSGLVYHCCYEAPNVAQSIDAVKADGLRVMTISPPKPAVLFGGRQVSFYQVAGYGMIELLERA